MKKIVLSVALFSVLVIFTGCDVIFNLNSNNDLSVDVGTKTDIGTNFLTVSESVVTEPIVTEPVVTEPIVTEPIVTEPIVTEPVVTEPVVTESVVTEPADESIGEFFRELPLFKKVSLCCALLIFFLLCLSFACILWLFFNDI